MNTTQNINAGINTAIGNAIHAANITKLKEDSATAPMLIPCVDLLGNKILVLADSQDREKDTIQYYNLKVSDKPQTATVAYYRSANKLDDETEVNKLFQAFYKATGIKQIIKRDRLVKESKVKRDDSGNINKADLEAWKVKLIQAISKVIEEM